MVEYLQLNACAAAATINATSAAGVVVILDAAA